jgi:membrane protein required for colicin V production
MIIDLVFVCLLVLALFKGYSRGLIIAIFTFLAYIIGLAAALKLSAVVAVSLAEKANVTSSWLPVLSFALVFIAVVIVVRLAAKALKKVVTLALLGWVDMIGGIVLYFLLYLFVYSVVLFYADKIGLISTETKAASKTFEYIAPIGPTVVDGIGKIMPVFRDLFDQLAHFFDGVAGERQ